MKGAEGRRGLRGAAGRSGSSGACAGAAGRNRARRNARETERDAAGRAPGDGAGPKGTPRGPSGLRAGAKRDAAAPRGAPRFDTARSGVGGAPGSAGRAVGALRAPAHTRADWAVPGSQLRRGRRRAGQWSGPLPPPRWLLKYPSGRSLSWAGSGRDPPPAGPLKRQTRPCPHWGAEGFRFPACLGWFRGAASQRTPGHLRVRALVWARLAQSAGEVVRGKWRPLPCPGERSFAAGDRCEPHSEGHPQASPLRTPELWVVLSPEHYPELV